MFFRLVIGFNSNMCLTAGLSLCHLDMSKDVLALHQSFWQSLQSDAL